MFGRPARSRWPRIHWVVVALVAAGGVAGGLVRYTVTDAWSTPAGAFPWAVFTVNTAGALVLGLLLAVTLELLPPSTYLRPAIGTGFCGGLTTFSSVVTDVDRLAAHGHVGVAVATVVANLAAGGLAVFVGIAVGRAVVRPERGRL